MAITVSGLRIDVLTATRVNDDIKLTGRYSILTSAGKVLAKQSFNEYQSLKLNPSPATIKALDALMEALKTDIGILTGLEGGN